MSASLQHVYLLTESRFVNPPKVDWYIQQILDEDNILSAALLTEGIEATRVDWDDEHIDWRAADAVIVRTCWDYFDRYDEFKKWFDSTSKLIRFINPAHQLEWNMDKHYLLDLEKKSIPIVPSVFLEVGETRALSIICSESKWTDLILKPCVSGSARHTYRLDNSNIEQHESIFRELVAKEPMMLQEFHASIQSRGEVSHMVMGGQYTHSILKRAKGEDFRVQDDFGGTVHPYEAGREEKEFAEKVFAACNPVPVYGRVDVMWDQEGNPLVSELEIIEPELWFREQPAAATVLAKSIKEHLKT